MRSTAEDLRGAGERRLLTAAGLGVVFLVTLLAYGADRTAWPMGGLDRLEGALLDASLRARGERAPDPRIIVVEIDQRAIDAFGRFPFPRTVFARALDALEAGGASVVLLDLLFTEPTEDPAEDAALVQALRSDDMAVVLGHFFYTEEPARPTPESAVKTFLAHEREVVSSLPPGSRAILDGNDARPPVASLHAAAEGSGFLNLRQGAGGVVRRAQLVIDHRDGLHASAALIAATLLELGGTGEGSPLFVGGAVGRPSLAHASGSVAMDAAGGALLNHPGPTSSYPSIGLAQLLSAAEAGDTAYLRERFEDKLVVLGPSAVGIWDQQATPFDRTAPAFVLHAAAIDNLLQGRFLQRPAWLLLLEYLLVAVLGSGITFLMARGSVWLGAAATPATCVALLLASRALVAGPELWFRPIMPIAAVLAAAIAVGVLRLNREAMHRAREAQRRREITGLFGRYVPPDLVQQLVEDPTAVPLASERRRITMLFSDIRGFTSLSEGIAPEELAALLSSYLDGQSRAIVDARGTVDKYLGDGIMALFGAPLGDEAHALHACNAALAKQTALEEFNAACLADGRLSKPLSIGIGVNTGYAAVGNLGSELRFDYTAIGDEVNLAARLEGLTKYYGVGCVISEAVLGDVGEAFCVRELDRVAVKGRTSAVAIFELVGPGDLEPPPWHAPYEAALQLYRNREWDEADRTCNRIIAEQEDGPTRFLKERIEERRREAPGPDWKAIERFASK